MEEDEGERKVCEEEDAERIPDEDRTAQLSKQILAQFAFAQAQPKKKMRGVEKEKKEKMRGVEKEKKEKMRGVEKKEKKEKMRGVEKKEKKEKSSASRGRARGVANSGSVVAVARKGTASSSGTTTAARRKKRKSTEDDDADDLVVEPQGIIKDELEEDEGLLWEEVEFEQPRSNESEGRNDNAADDHAEDQGDDNDDDDDAFLVPAQPATKSSAKARQRKPKAVEPKQESRKSAGPAALSTDLQNLIMKGKQKRKRNESKKDKKEQTSRQQQAEKRQRKEKQQMAVEVHKTHLLCLLAHHYHTNTQLEDELLQSTLLSLVPSDLWILHPNVGHEPDLKKRLRELMKWFRATFEIDNAALAEERAAEEAEAAALEKKGAAEWKKEAHESRFGVLPDRLMRVIEQKKGTPTQIAQLFVSLCRTLSLTTRYVAVLDPITFKTATPRKPPQRPAASSKGKSKSSKSLFDEDEGEDEEQESRGGKGKRKRTQAPAPRKRQSPAKKEVDEEGNEEGDEAEDDFLTLVPSLMPRFAYSPTDDSDPAKPRPTTTSSTSAGTSPSAAAAGAGGRLTPSPSKRPRRTTPTTTPSPLTSPPLSTSTSATPTAKRLQGGIPRDMPSLWAEIYYPRETRWIHVDIVRNAVDQPQYYEETYPSIQLAYVASLAEGSLSVRDVTRRYTSRWSEVTQRRMPEPDWWHQTLSVISRPTEAMLDQNAYDESEQKGRELTEQMPTTLSAFKTHPLYCLERFVHKYEALYPRGPVLGEFKGQPIYPRSCVRKLHTKDKWIQKARAVREDEVPIKRVRKIIKKKTKKKGNGRDEKDQEEEAASQSLFNDDNEDEAEEDPNVPPEERDPISSQKKRKGKGKAGDDDPDNYVDLYGKWQTEDYVPPMALDGVVPKNEFGNIYLFKPSMLPVGAAHVKYPNACTIARRINVDCAPAMVGWRWAGARSVPEIEGVVVCEEYASLIEELCQEELERKFQAELEKRRKAVAERWKRMAKKLIVKQHLRDKYEAQQHEQGQGQGQVLLDVTQESGEEKEKAKELTITVDKAQLESRRRGVELNHTHAFGEERCVDPDEDLWEKTCSQCGFVLAFEKM